MDPSTAATQQVCAAWVQAIGAIAGIAVTVFIFWRQSRAMRHQMNSGRLALLDGILAIFQDVEIALHELILQWDSAQNPQPRHFGSSKARFLQALTALDQLPLHEVQPYESMTAFLSAKRVLRDCVGRLTRPVGAIEVNGERINDFREWAAEFAIHRAVISDQARRLRT
ncbi:hypothetical protein NE850_17985 [Paraburkholderia sp. USG1]|uniref:hypothetical protein n=1 Tax=Paraburkholderia sp. USG1 TaxID=2952268 RepID=UPI00285CD46F|nr:hypothetical protein [Paraburkholderia sp. USG1]MDR8398234.1 hypothetical protein [Paraburkholderia sp. USG1]